MQALLGPLLGTVSASILSTFPTEQQIAHLISSTDIQAGQDLPHHIFTNTHPPPSKYLVRSHIDI